MDSSIAFSSSGVALAVEVDMENYTTAVIEGEVVGADDGSSVGNDDVIRDGNGVAKAWSRFARNDLKLDPQPKLLLLLGNPDASSKALRSDPSYFHSQAKVGKLD